MEQKEIEKKIDAGQEERNWLEIFDEMCNVWQTLDELRMKVLKNLWDANGNPYPNDVKKELEDYGLL